MELIKATYEDMLDIAKLLFGERMLEDGKQHQIIGFTKEFCLPLVLTFNKEQSMHNISCSGNFKFIQETVIEYYIKKGIYTAVNTESYREGICLTFFKFNK